MLLQILHISIIASLLFQQCQLAAVCILFKVKQPYLTRNVCLDRNNPYSECKAHCQLVKRINEQENQENNSKIFFKEQAEFVAHLKRPTLKPKYFFDTRFVWENHQYEEILSGFCVCFYPPPDQA